MCRRGSEMLAGKKNRMRQKETNFAAVRVEADARSRVDFVNMLAFPGKSAVLCGPGPREEMRKRWVPLALCKNPSALYVVMYDCIHICPALLDHTCSALQQTSLSKEAIKCTFD